LRKDVIARTKIKEERSVDVDVPPIQQKYAVMYLRIASSHPEDAHAVASQRYGCMQIAAKYGLQVIREYIDSGVPARFGRQTELLRLLGDLARHRDAACVVVWDYSRLGRSLEQLDDIAQRLADCGAAVITLTGVETARRLQQTYRAPFDEPPP
jgi:DNA invertase Pin-like site-specific DNA recombinase